MNKIGEEDEDGDVDLSEYERIRVRNIHRNNARLRALGLISTAEETRSNALARNFSNKIKLKSDDRSSNLKRKHVENSQPVRKSRRLQGLAVTDEDIQLPDDRRQIEFSHNSEDEDALIEQERERLERVSECREMRRKAAIALAQECGSFDAAAKTNPTATYDHALHRIRTMSIKALANRVKTIERAMGKHCIIKMAIFKCALQDEGLWDLAGLASEALERLKGNDWVPMDRKDRT